MRALIAIPALLLALNASADCPVEHPRNVPVLPDVTVASKAEMYQAQLAAEMYILQAKTYLECGYMNKRQYNILLSQLEMFSEQYDEALIEYRVRSNMIAKK